MHNIKLLKILKSLNRKEFKRFEEFVDSPFFNKNESLRILLRDLANYHPDFEGESLLIENVFKRIFPDSKYDYHKICNLTSDLYQLSKTFLKNIANEENEIESNINLLVKLDEKKLNNAYDQVEKDVRSKLFNSKIKDEEYYFLNFKLNRSNSSYHLFKKNNPDYSVIQNEFDSFLQYSLIGLLRLYAKLLHNKNHGKMEYRMDMFDMFWEYIREKDFTNSPLHLIYISIISLETDKTEKSYRKLISLKKKYDDQVSQDDMHNILIFMNSFVAYRLNKFGDETYYKDRFDLLNELIIRGFLTSEGIAYSDYTYIFSAACTVKKFEWANKFKNDFLEGITPKEEQMNAVTFCNAYMDYTKGKFSQALDNFSKTGFKLFFMKVTVKSLMIRIFYETNMYEQFISAVDSFRHYLKREKLIHDEQKKAHYDFLIFTSALFKLKVETNIKKRSSELAVLRKQISRMDNSAFGIKNWLHKKTDEFI